MPDQYYDNYRLLAGAIIEEQLREYHESYLKYLKHPTSKRRKDKVNFKRHMLLEFSFGSYLNLDMKVLVEEVERKAREGEEIRWKSSYRR